MRVPPIYPHLISGLDSYYRGSGSAKTESARALRTRSSRSADLRILLSTFWKYPANGGLSNYLSALKSSLEKRGHRVDIIHPEFFPQRDLRAMHEKAEDEVRRFLRSRYGQVNEDIVSSLRSMLSYEALLSTTDLKKYDVLHAQDRFTANILGRLNQSYNKPLFFTSHGPMTHRRVQLNLIKRGSVEEAYFFKIDRRAVEVADKVVMLSEALRPIFTDLGADSRKLATIYTGIKLKQGSGKPKKDRLLISCVSRLSSRKGHKVLLDALHRIRQHLANVRVYIVGDGEMRGELERLSSKLKLREVSFLGHRDDVADILSRSDIYVLPTTNDTLPISIIEAMFAGKAIVTTRCGGIPEIIRHQETGLLVDPENVDQLAASLLQLMQDRQLMKKLGNNALQFAKTHLRTDKMASKMEHLYQSVL